MTGHGKASIVLEMSEQEAKACLIMLGPLNGVMAYTICKAIELALIEAKEG